MRYPTFQNGQTAKISIVNFHIILVIYNEKDSQWNSLAPIDASLFIGEVLKVTLDDKISYGTASLKNQNSCDSYMGNCKGLPLTTYGLALIQYSGIKSI